jgi:eukaryotic translation initiation factor 2C
MAVAGGGGARETPMARPAAARSVGRAGRPIELEANFFALKVAGLRQIWQYNVDIVCDKRARGAAGTDPVEGKDVAGVQPVAVNRAVFRRFLAAAAAAGAEAVAYDGRKIAYAAREMPAGVVGRDWRLPCDGEGAAVAEGATVNGRPARVDWMTVRMKMTAVLDPAEVVSGRAGGVDASVQPVMNALDVALGEGNSGRYVEVGRTFYSDHGAVDLGGGAQAWRGFYQSIRMTQGGLAVNVDESFTPFWMQGSALELVKATNRGQLPRDAMGWRRAGKELHSVRVKAQHTGISYRVFGFSPQGADRTMFRDRAGTQVSVAAYMLSEYGRTLGQPGLPCARVHPRRDIFVPLELLSVCAKQRRAKAMSPAQTTQMIRIAALKPDARKQSARGSIAGARYNEDATCRAFGMAVNPQLVKVQARVLPTPDLEYGGGQRLRAANGSWNMARNKMFLGSRLQYWIVVQVGRYMRQDDLATFIRQMGDVGSSNGVDFRNRNPTVYDNVSEHGFEKFLSATIQKETEKARQVHPSHFLQLVVVIKEKQDAAIYNTVKRVCDLQLGVASQCMLSKKITTQRQVQQYIANVMLKINAKLGGHNVYVPPAQVRASNPAFVHRPHIVLGADVTHPAPGSGARPSVAALVGSLDKGGMQYTGALRNQTSRQEIIEDIEGMFLEVYRRWFNNYTPRVHAESIIMFRDGVSEGQYQQVLDSELPAIRNACRHSCGFEPKITFVIVTKRHHARFFGTDKTKPADLDRTRNIVAGTVIDTGIVSTNVWDFYLNSHAGIQGTNRPSKYTVLVDDNNVTADQLQGYIFRLSHGYARCTRSVSMVNSAYYAHLLAFRGRIFLGDEGSDDAASVASANSAVVPATEKPHDLVAGRLFFV